MLADGHAGGRLWCQLAPSLCCTISFRVRIVHCARKLATNPPRPHAPAGVIALGSCDPPATKSDVGIGLGSSQKHFGSPTSSTRDGGGSDSGLRNCTARLLNAAGYCAFCGSGSVVSSGAGVVPMHDVAWAVSFRIALYALYGIEYVPERRHKGEGTHGCQHGAVTRQDRLCGVADGGAEGVTTPGKGRKGDWRGPRRGDREDRDRDRDR